MNSGVLFCLLGGLVALSNSCELINATLFPDCIEAAGYNMTVYPTLNGLSNQKEAAKQLDDFIPHIKRAECSEYALLFLCSYHAPICQEVSQGKHYTVSPCKSLCNKVYDDCLPFLTKENITWPEHLECHNFHSNKSNDCFGPDNYSTIYQHTPTVTPISTSLTTSIATSSYTCISQTTKDKEMRTSTSYVEATSTPSVPEPTESPGKTTQDKEMRTSTLCMEATSTPSVPEPTDLPEPTESPGNASTYSKPIAGLFILIIITLCLVY
ncbi:uncharacterized protein LOC100632403 precursor [Amphimedon queenslandica]|uniref:SFRPC n=1 Tax=Amphimedon queenslandica TaxID=400682 RepID=E2IJA1_AMPQE|nr:uncharacterized protein LOC100632403 precursor [Amphimedon queenslandica]ADO16573.1 sFRPC [Amphimedon queenslandica]|eukprot:NP_001295552.1 uncharacterized protein LOC100632403 precursor [Amphimedon queenslandica]